MTQPLFDVAIIGTGLAGTALAAILARQGQSVLMFEAGSHPRFAIGESLILETSETMRALATLYDVPEIAYFSTENFMPHIGTSHGIKRHFGFLQHFPGQPHDPHHTLQAVIPREPHGHELHLFRQDSDQQMLTAAIAHGATVLQKTPVTEVDFDDDGVTIHAPQGAAYRARYIVDAGGFRSPLAQKFDLRHTDLRTHSRALFTHMVGVTPYQKAVAPDLQYDLPFPMSEGTLHHLFDGGWLWVIPFNNHAQATNPLCSVGLLLDPRRHPLPEGLTPEEEFRAFINRYPSMAAQFTQARAVRDWTRTGRIQYGSRRVVGDRWALLGHAAGFIDPLYSKGLYASLTAVSLTAHLLLQAQKTGDYSAAAFGELERQSQVFLESFDRLVANSYKSFAHPKLWQVYAVMWLLGAYTELVKLNMMRARAGHDREAYYRELGELKLVGGGFAEFDVVAAQIDALFETVDPGDEAAVDETVRQANAIFAAIDWMADPFRALLQGKTSLPRNKLRLSLLKKDEGFMGHGAYRAHFFRDMTMANILRYGAREKIVYSVPYQKLQQRRRYRRQAAGG